MNKKSNSDYNVDPNGPHFPFKLINPRKVCSHELFSDHGHILPPIKCTDRKAAPSTEHFSIHPLWDLLIFSAVNLFSTQNHFDKPSRSPPSPCLYVHNSCWNLEHPNSFTPLEKLLDFDNPALADNAARYNMVVMETAPNTLPRSPGPSDFLLQEINAPEAHLSQNTDANQSEVVCNSANHTATRAANERPHTSVIKCMTYLWLAPAINQSSCMQARPLPPQQKPMRWLVAMQPQLLAFPMQTAT
ncbi:hypothetical protein DSO57_1028183 [Entomophthora muscae]|uniref:Uncharacterized protein n=1 Tax=Entomophthora muscae TaxID=34485 RepID=A0ACC2RGB5_9FUNG|nr:hypothetical protein DSO57_1028183 [Entomophthora muscae]